MFTALSNSKFITQVSLFLAFLANLSSIYFAYILYFVLYNLCVVCVSTYVVNIINLSLVYFKLKSLKKGAEAASRTSSAQKLKKKQIKEKFVWKNCKFLCNFVTYFDLEALCFTRILLKPRRLMYYFISAVLFF